MIKYRESLQVEIQQETFAFCLQIKFMSNWSRMTKVTTVKVAYISMSDRHLNKNFWPSRHNHSNLQVNTSVPDQNLFIDNNQIQTIIFLPKQIIWNKELQYVTKTPVLPSYRSSPL